MSIFNDVINLVNDGASILLFFLLEERNEEPVIKFANIADENNGNNTTTDLFNAYKELIENKFSDLEQEDIINLSSADDRLGAVYKYDLEEIPSLFSSMRTTLENLEPSALSTFNHNSDNFEDVKGLIIVIGDAQNKVVLYKKNYPISLLRRDKFALIPIPRSTRLKKVSDDILKIDINLHFMLFNNEFYIFDLKKMEQLIGYDGIIKKEAMKSIGAIKDMGLLQDVQPLIDDIDDITFSRKLTKVYKDSKVIGRVSNQNIISFVKEHSYFKKNPIKYDELDYKLTIDTKTSKKALVKLLNDDLLHSDLTKFEYDSVAKNSLETNE